MTTGKLRNTVVIVLVAAVLAGGWLVAPGSAHDSPSILHNWQRHYAPLAKKIFFTKAASNARFVRTGQSNDVQWFKEAADSAGVTATSERVVFAAPEGITITDVFVEPAAAVTADDVNFATIVVSRRDGTGGNRVTVASSTTETSGSGGSGDWTAFGKVSLAPFSNTSLTEGQKLTIEVTKTGVGVALPVLIVQIEYRVN